jgi:hypothetical protein
MIKFFRKIRQKMLTENKFSKYLLYAIGEIILVVIGILIALQLNTAKENKEKSELGYKYLTEMRQEVQNDIFMLDTHIRRLDISIKNQEASLHTKSIATLPLDSLLMIMDRQNIDLNISELTFNRMKNLGLTSLSNNDSLNSKISNYYNNELVFFKRAMSFIYENTKQYSHYLTYEQEIIDFRLNEVEFPTLYSQPKETRDSINRLNRINFITSIKGRHLILQDLEQRRYSLQVLNGMQKQSVKFLKSIYAELKILNPKMEPLPLLPTEMDFKEIDVSTKVLKTYTGKYLTESKDTLNVIQEGKRIYVEFDSKKTEIFPYEEDKFFMKDFFAPIEFNKEEGKITSFTLSNNGKFDFKKLD